VSIYKFEHYVGRHPDTPAYFVGKGPSLDLLTKEHFPSNAVVFAINDSIHKVERLHLPNQAYCVQQDPKQLLDSPVRAVHFVSPRAEPFSFHRGVLYDLKELKVKYTDRTILVAVEIAKRMGISEFHFLCFDSCINGSIEYAVCSKAPRMNETYKRGLRAQKEKIEQRAKPGKCHWHSVASLEVK
jgi:hypothetical protein